MTSLEADSVLAGELPQLVGVCDCAFVEFETVRAGDTSGDVALRLEGSFGVEARVFALTVPPVVAHGQLGKLGKVFALVYFPNRFVCGNKHQQVSTLNRIAAAVVKDWSIKEIEEHKVKFWSYQGLDDYESVLHFLTSQAKSIEKDHVRLGGTAWGRPIEASDKSVVVWQDSFHERMYYQPSGIGQSITIHLWEFVRRAEGHLSA